MILASVTDWMQAVGTTVSGIGVIVAIVYAARQAGSLAREVQAFESEQRRSLRVRQASLDMRLLELMLAFDRIFIDQPDLRPYIYEQAPLPDDPRKYDQVVSVAELLLDLADIVSNQRRHGQLDDVDYELWAEAFRSYYASSPAVRLVLSEWADLYRAETHNLVTGDARGAPTLSLRRPSETDEKQLAGRARDSNARGTPEG